jgi:iron complex transport system ATP-binding protein
VKIIELENVSFCYGNTRADFCLSDINIKIDKNEFVSIIGANGCGKSTLIKIAAGLLKPISGKVRINNSEYENYSRIDLAKLIAYVPQLYYSVYPYSVFEVVMMGRNPHLNIFGYENKFDIELVNDVLEKVGLYNLKKQKYK